MKSTAPIEGVVAWPTDVAEHYRRAGYWRGVSIASQIAEQVQRRPDQEALIDGDCRLTYRELWTRAGAGAQTLLELGIARGDRIVLQLPNCWQFVALTLACLRVGIIPVMALPSHRQHEIAHLAALSDAVALVIPEMDSGTDMRPIARRVAAEVPTVSAILVHGAPSSSMPKECPEHALATVWNNVIRFVEANYDPAGSDLACLLLSGGTTGLPKLIARTNDDYAYNIRQCSEVSGVGSHTTYLCALPASHNFTLACPGLLGALVAGGQVVMLPSPSAERALQTIDTLAITLTAVVPAVAHRWINYQREHRLLRGPSLRVLQVGGARMPDELAALVQPVLGAQLQQVFGMAEGLINMTRLDDHADVVLTTQGRPVSEADEIRVVDPEGEPVPNGVPGTLLTRGPYTPRGYFRAAEHNARAFTAQGWYVTGDIVVQREDGNLVVAGRDKDMINRGGEKISAEEIENFAYRFTGVESAAAVAMPDPVLGERLCLYLSLAQGHSMITLADIVQEMTAAGFARFKHPDRLEIIDQMPLSKVGKIDKKALRDDIRARLAVGETIGD